MGKGQGSNTRGESAVTPEQWEASDNGRLLVDYIYFWADQHYASIECARAEGRTAEHSGEGFWDCPASADDRALIERCARRFGMSEPDLRVLVRTTERDIRDRRTPGPRY